MRICLPGGSWSTRHAAGCERCPRRRAWLLQLLTCAGLPKKKGGLSQKMRRSTVIKSRRRPAEPVCRFYPHCCRYARHISHWCDVCTSQHMFPEYYPPVCQPAYCSPPPCYPPWQAPPPCYPPCHPPPPYAAPPPYAPCYAPPCDTACAPHHAPAHCTAPCHEPPYHEYCEPPCYAPREGARRTGSVEPSRDPPISRCAVSCEPPCAPRDAQGRASGEPSCAPLSYAS